MSETRCTRRDTICATARVVGALLTFCLVAAGFTGAQASSSASVGGLRAAVRMPYTDGGRTAAANPASSDGAFALDLLNEPGVPVYARLASSDGRVTIAVGSIGRNAGDAGRSVQVNVFVAGTQVGTLDYEHLANVQVAPDTSYPAGQLLGYTGSGAFPTATCADGFADSTASQPCTPAEVPTDVAVTGGCWRSPRTTADASPDEAIAMLSAGLPTSADAPCDNAELDAVNAQAATPVAAAVRAAPVVQRQNGSIHVFADGDGGALLHKWVDTSVWLPLPAGSFETLGSGLVGTPTALVRKDGTLDVFARGADGSLLHKWMLQSGGWRPLPAGGFEVLGSGLAGDPQAIQTADGTIHVFARDADGGLVHAWLGPTGGWQPSPFGPFQVLGSGLIGDPVVTQRQDGTLDVFACGSGGELLHKWLSGTGGWQPSPFGPFERLGSGLAGTPAALVRDNGILDVFARGSGGELLHKWLPASGGWQPSASGSFAQLGGGLAGDPQAIQTADGITNVFARDAAGGLAHKWIQLSGDWRPSPLGPFEVLGSGTTGGSALLQRHRGWLDVFVRSTTGQLAHKWYGLDIQWQPSQFGPFETLGSGLGPASFRAETPAAPGGVTATARLREATVSWAAPAFDGNAPILDYEVRSSPDDIALRAASPATSLVVEGLREGVAYTFTVRARNAVGYGPPSASNAVTPTGPPPPPTTTVPTTTTPTTTTPTTTPATTTTTASQPLGTTVSTTTTTATTPKAPKPRARCSVPNVRGKNLATARAIVGAHHCRTGRIKTTPSSRRMHGRVIAQAPPAGAVRANGTRVSLWLGAGPKR